MLLGLLPLLATAILFVCISNKYSNWDWRLCYLRSIVISGGYLVLSTEILSIFRLVNRTSIFATWFLPILVGVVRILRHLRNGDRIRKLHMHILEKPGYLSGVLWIGILLILIVTSLIAWIWLPNTWDSLRYHMPRVAHWAQEHAVVHFATGIEVQNGIGPFAEYAILHTYLLANGDRWANFIEWFAMFSSMIGVMHLTSKLGGSKTAQNLSAVLLVTLPMGIAQATSTMTDFVVALFVVASASEVVSMHMEQVRDSNVILLGLSAGLAIGIKPTAYAYLLPFALYTLVVLLKRVNLLQIARYSILVLTTIFILNAGQMTRNLKTYGNPIGASYLVAEQTNELMTMSGWISNLVRHASLHAGTPWDPVNTFIYKGIVKIHLILNLSMDDPRTTSIGPYMFWAPRLEETFAGNSQHAYLFLVVAILSLLVIRKTPLELYIYGLVVITTFMVFSIVFKWQVFSARYHLPFFVLFIPFPAVIMSRLMPRWTNNLIGVGFIVLAWPWVFNLENRSINQHIQAFQSSETNDSVMSFFNMGERQYTEFLPITNPISDVGCSQVAMLISGNGREYPFWRNLGAPRDDLKLEWIVVGTPSEKYRDQSFTPCAAICQYCPSEWTIFRDLYLSLKDREYVLFLKE